MGNLDSKYAFRTEMVDRLVRDLYGPETIDELLDERPLDRYLTGVLWPQSDDAQEDVPDDADAATGDDDEVLDSPVASSRMTYPSSIGMTFTVDLNVADRVIIHPKAARYVPVSTAHEATDPDAEGTTRASKSIVDQWGRRELSLAPISIDLLSPPSVPEPLVIDALELYILVRPPIQGAVTVTVALRNLLRKPAEGDRDANCWFQVGLGVETKTLRSWIVRHFTRVSPTTATWRRRNSCTEMHECLLQVMGALPPGRRKTSTRAFAVVQRRHSYRGKKFPEP
ncbi:hypothetical protein PJ267_09070 [Arthrobacter sp. OVS8]|nr:hypothetical protein PJ267_09070 [Arthrobacter sp. OVS8]